MDVIHIAKLGRLKHVHVTVDTYSGFLMVTAQTGEATKLVISHCLKCFAYMGGSGYTSKAFQHFVHNKKLNI